MIHERFDLARWQTEQPLTGLARDTDANETPSSGPLVIAYAEQIRAKLRAAGHDLGPGKPTDLCVWNWGDSERRDVTKIGGIPYWPAGEPWPFGCIHQKPCTFIAQFCFADSKDILPTLPGDILSVLFDGWEVGAPVFRWFWLGAALEDPAALPSPEEEIAPCHAALHRTMDYPDANWDLFDPYPRPLAAEAMWFRHQTKIGGHWDMHGEVPDPDWYDDPDMREFMRENQREAMEMVKRRQGEFIGHLHSVRLKLGQRWPFLNVQTRDSLPYEKDSKRLMIADCGGIDLFWNGIDLHSEVGSG